MTPSADGMINCRECKLKLRIADGSTRTIEGYGDINFVFRSGNGLVQVTLTNVGHVPDLRHHLFSLPTLVKHGHTFEGRSAGTVVKLNSERSIVFPLTGTCTAFRATGSTAALERCLCCTRPGKTAKQARCQHKRQPLRGRTLPRGTAPQDRGAARKGSSLRENCWSAKGALWRRVSAEVSSSPHTLEQVRSSGGFCGFEWA